MVAPTIKIKHTQFLWCPTKICFKAEKASIPAKSINRTPSKCGFQGCIYIYIVGKLLSLRTVGRSPEICEDDNVLASVVMAEEVGVAQS